MATIFLPISQNTEIEDAMVEWPELDVTLTHLISSDGDHSECGLAFGGIAETGNGKVTCPDCVKEIVRMKKLKKGRDYDI